MLDKKLDEYVTRVENDAYELGISVGKNQERERIVDLLKDTHIERACEVMHDAYEEAAKSTGWETQESSRVAWAEVPESNKQTMVQAVSALVGHLITLIEGDNQ